MRTFEFVMDGLGNKMFEKAQMPVYATKESAGADFFCAEDVVIPPTKVIEVDCPEGEYDKVDYVVEARPTLVHTGICAKLESGDVLTLYNRYGGADNQLVQAGTRVVDVDYYDARTAGSDITFAFYNFSSAPIEIKAGERIGQGVITKFLCVDNAVVAENGR